MKKRDFMLSALLIGAVSLAPPVQAAETISFADFYSKVLEYYPSLQRQHARVEQAIAAKLEAFSGFLPFVQGSASMVTTDDPVGVFGSLLRQEDFTVENFELSSLNSPRHRTNYNFTLQASLPLFNAFQTLSRFRSARNFEASEKWNRVFSEMEMRLVSLDAYGHVAVSKKVSRLSEALAAAAREDVNQALDLKEKGLIFGADFYAAKVLLSQLLQRNHQLAASEKLALISANTVSGQDPLRQWETELRDDLPKLDDLPELELLMSQALLSRPDYLAMDEMVKAKQREIFREKASILPRVDGFTTLTEDSHDLRSGGGNFALGVKSSMDLLDPSYYARIQKAKAAAREIEAHRNELKESIRREVSREYLHYEMLQKDAVIIREAEADAAEAMKLTAELYKEGRKSIADVLEMRLSCLQAAVQSAELAVRLRIQRAGVLLAAGLLTDAALEEVVGSGREH